MPDVLCHYTGTLTFTDSSVVTVDDADDENALLAAIRREHPDAHGLELESWQEVQHRDE